MKATVTAGLVLWAAAGAAMAQVSPSLTELPPGSAEAALYQAARRIVALQDGSRLIVHVIHYETQPSSVGATIVGPNGRIAQRLTAAESIKGNLRPGSGLGLITWGTLFGQPESLALTLAWANRFGAAENGIAILRREPGGRWIPDRMLPYEGTLGTLTEGPDATLLASSFRPVKSRGPAALTLFGSEGPILGEFLPRPAAITSGDAATGALGSIVVRLAANRYALFDNLSTTVQLLRVSPLFEVSVDGEIPVGGLPAEHFDAGARVTLQTFCVLTDGSVVVARTGVSKDRGKVATVLSTYTGGIEPESNVRLSSVWRTAFCEAGRLTGVVVQKDEGVVLESLAAEPPRWTRRGARLRAPPSQ